MKKIIRGSERVVDRHSEYTRDELVALLDAEIAKLPEDQRASATFEIDEYGYNYDDTTYHALFMKWDRPETDEEEAKREASEAQQAAWRAMAERAEFERLKKKFGE